MAETVQFSGYTAADLRYFVEDPAYNNQITDFQGSLIARPELRFASHRGDHQLKITPFFRWDSEDSDRTHFDLREAYYRHTRGSWQFLVGLNKVFWGVTESQHLIDIVNQTDNLEDIDQEKKLGQPMILIGSERDWGELHLYLLPYFRELEFPGESGRLRAGLPIDKDSQYESGAEEQHLDLALRYSHYFDDWDFGVYYFYGTSRQPLFIPNVTNNSLTPHYSLIHQSGIDIQYTNEAWLWKFEGLLRDGEEEVFAAVVGGFEYTFYQLFGSAMDIGILAEYNWDGRNDKEPGTLFDNDLFFGSRLALNDSQDTTALIGAIIDTENNSTIISAEFSRRIADSWKIELVGRYFLDIDEKDLLQTYSEDSFINISLQYHF